MELIRPCASDIPPMVHGDRNMAAWSGEWWVIHTKARQEKAIAKILAGLDVHYFLPLWEKKAVISGKLRSNWLPVFTSYLFVNGSAEVKSEVLRTHRAAGVFPVPAAERPRFLAEITQIANALAAVDGAVEPCSLQVGQRCRVTCGPLMGMEGALIALDAKRCQVVLAVSLLSQAVSVEMSLSEVEPA